MFQHAFDASCLSIKPYGHLHPDVLTPADAKHPNIKDSQVYLVYYSYEPVVSVTEALKQSVASSIDSS